MEFFGPSAEYLLVSNLKNTDTEIINKNNDNTLSVFWNSENETTLIIDNVIYVLKANQMVF